MGGDLGTRQCQDPLLAEIICLLETGSLPTDPKRTKLLALTQSQYTLEDNVLFHVTRDGSLRVIPPADSREELFNQAHGDVFGGHLREAKVFTELQKHYWWQGMRADISRWSRGCLVCITHNTGRPARGPVTPIPVWTFQESWCGCDPVPML